MLIGSFRVFDLELLLRTLLLDAHTATAMNATGPTTAPTMTGVETAAELEEDFAESYIIYIIDIIPSQGKRLSYRGCSRRRTVGWWQVAV